MKTGVFTTVNLKFYGAGASALRVEELTKYLPKYGCSVSLFSPGDLPDELRDRVKHISLNRMRRYINIPPYFPQLSNIFSKSFLPLNYIVSKLPEPSKLVSEDYDILHCHQHEAANIALMLKRWINAPILFDMHGVNALQPKLSSFPPLTHFIKTNEKVLLKNVDAISVVSYPLKRYIMNAFKVPEDKIFIIPDGADIDLMQTPIQEDAKTNLISSLGLGLGSGKKIIMYIGSFGALHGTLEMLKVIDVINHKLKNAKKEIVLVLVGGHKSFLSIMKKYIQEHDLSNVHLCDPIPHRDVPLYYSIADVLVSTYTKNKANALIVLGTKYKEYLASGKPIVATNVGFAGKTLKDNDAAVLAELGNPESIAEGILKALYDEEVRRRIVDNGKKLVTEEWSWEKSAEKAVEVYKIMLEKF
jgi:glycosyltransferase involved in cell wall biosynthesis